MISKPSIMVLIDWFAPGFRAGGPIRSCVNFTTTMQEDFEIFVVTTNRDLGIAEPFSEILPNAWLPFSSHAKVWYFSDSRLSYKNLLNLVKEVNPEFLYVNSLYSLPFTIWPLRMKFSGAFHGKVILAPRGMLKPAALAVKPLKKKVFLNLMKFLRIHKSIMFHATNEEEAKEVKLHFGKEQDVRIAPNLPQMFQEPRREMIKKTGEVKFSFLGRVHPYKNLLWLLKRLENLKGKMTLTIYGPVEDEAYWTECIQRMESLPGHIEVQYHGGLAAEDVSAALEAGHFLTLPTQGENFGHAIFESLLVGRPVIISERTPWNDLEEKYAGWVIPLDSPRIYEKKLQELVDMDQEEYNYWSEGSWQYANKYIRESRLKEQYLELFSDT